MESAALDASNMPGANMMDSDINAGIDDLFGDAADDLAAENLGVALPPIHLPLELVLRIADMQRLGCST